MLRLRLTPPRPIIMSRRPNQRSSSTKTFLVIACLAVLLAVFWPDGTRPNGPSGSRPLIGATIFPLYDIARNVAGDAVDVVLLTPPGASPHTFEPRPSDLRKLTGAAVVYAVGHGIDNWVTGLASANNTPIVSVDRGIDILPARGGEDGDAGDPHYWLDPKNAALIAGNIADDLAGRFPGSAAALRRNLRAYLPELGRAEAQARGLLAGLPVRNIVTLHDAWYYFARAFDLNVTGSLEPTAGREPTPQYLAALQTAVAVSGAKTVYAEPQLNTMSLEPFARDNDLTIATLDPIGGVAGRDTYVKLLLYNANIIRENQR